MTGKFEAVSMTLNLFLEVKHLGMKLFRQVSRTVS
jgi:hypothetical protein